MFQVNMYIYIGIVFYQRERLFVFVIRDWQRHEYLRSINANVAAGLYSLCTSSPTDIYM